MGVKSIALGLTGDKSVFYDGDVVEGVCVVEIGGHSPVASITVRIKGLAKVQWYERNGKSRLVNRSAESPLLHSEKFLSIGLAPLAVGLHQLPFSFRLPTRVVTTLEGGYGYVRYWLEAEEPHYWLSSNPNKRTKLQLKVLQLIDTNQPQYRFPIAGKDTKTNCCFCCESGPLFIEAQSDRAAYCPNDIVTISATFRNNSNKQARPFAKLVQTRTFYANGKQKKSDDSMKLQPVDAAGDSTQNYLYEGGCTTWNAMQFRIPECLPSVDCGIIQVSYKIEVGLDISWAFDLEVYLPIVIGTIPYRGEQPQSANRQVSFLPSSVVHWSGTGRQTASRLPIQSVPPLLPPLKSASASGVEPPSYFDFILQSEVPTLDKDDIGPVNNNNNNNNNNLMQNDPSSSFDEDTKVVEDSNTATS